MATRRPPPSRVRVRRDTTRRSNSNAAAVAAAQPFIPSDDDEDSGEQQPFTGGLPGPTEPPPPPPPPPPGQVTFEDIGDESGGPGGFNAAAGLAYERPNPVAVPGNVWFPVGPFTGPVMIVPSLFVTEGTILAHPVVRPPFETLVHRSGGKGSLYLPYIGNEVWFLKYTGASALSYIVLDIRDPSFGAYLQGSMVGASAEPTPVTTDILTGAGAVTLLAANLDRFAVEIASEDAVYLGWNGATPSFVSATSYVGRPLGRGSVVTYSGDTNILSAIEVVAGANDSLVTVTEWVR